MSRRKAKSTKIDSAWLREARTKSPSAPGIYRFIGEGDTPIYVGKSSHLKRRMGQYVNAKRLKKHRKMLLIIRSASRVEFEVCASPLDARLRELELIQKLRPRWNIEGAFHFLYPTLGIYGSDRILKIALTTHPTEFDAAEPGFRWFGAFRSRELTRTGFFSIGALFRHLSHREKWPTPSNLPPHTYRIAFRFSNSEDRAFWDLQLREFLLAGSNGFCSNLSLALLDHPGARAKASATQALLQQIELFRKHEVLPLRDALKGREFVSQNERDALFARHRGAVAAPE